MAHYLMITWGGAGNQPPMSGLAAELAAHGHTVTFAGYPDQRDRFAGFDFRVLPRAQHAWPDQPPPDWMPVLVDAVWACPAHLDDVPELVAETGCDVLVVDCLMFAALAAGELLDVPTVALVHSAPGAMTPPGGGLDRLVLDSVNAVRSTAGLTPLGTLWDAWRPGTTICTSVRELDPDAARVPAEFVYVGPIVEPQPPSGWRWPWSLEDDRPLALASFSSGAAWDQTSRIHRTAAALAGRYRVLVTAGPFDVDGPARPDVAVTPFLPHAEVLPSAAVTITHAGHGTVAASLAHGVPIVALPNLAADQPALAAHLDRLGAGIALDGEAATSDDIARAVNTVLEDPGYAAAAWDLSRAITRSPGAAGAAERLAALA